MVSSAIVFIPKIGLSTFVGAIIVRQIIAALLLDHFIVLGLPKKTLTVQRALGSCLLVSRYVLKRR